MMLRWRWHSERRHSRRPTVFAARYRRHGRITAGRCCSCRSGARIQIRIRIVCIGRCVASVSTARRIIGGTRLTGRCEHGITAVRTVAVKIAIAVHEMGAAIAWRRFATVRRRTERTDVFDAQRTRQSAKVDGFRWRRCVCGRMVGLLLLLMMVLLLLLLSLNILWTGATTDGQNDKHDGLEPGKRKAPSDADVCTYPTRPTLRSSVCPCGLNICGLE